MRTPLTKAKAWNAYRKLIEASDDMRELLDIDPKDEAASIVLKKLEEQLMKFDLELYPTLSK